MNLKTKILLLIALCTLFLVPCASASSIIQSCSIAATAINSYPQTCTPSFEEFNPAWGTLTAIVIQLTNVNGESGPDIANNDTVSSYTFTNAQGDVSLLITAGTGEFVAVTSPLEPPGGCNGTVPANSTGGYIPVGCTGSPAAFSGLSSSAVNIAAGNFASYTGTGSLASTFFASSTSSAGSGFGGTGSGGHLFFGGTGTIGGTLTLEYDYTPPTQEPMTTMMVGGGLVGLGVLLRKRNKRA